MVEVCPICARDEFDMRHVAVECFYDVQEVAPSAEKQTIFRKLNHDASVFGTTYHYPDGTRDFHRIERTEDGTNHLRVDQVPCEPVRLIEQQLFSVVKECRGDFLRLFGEWASGTYVSFSEADDVHNIPVRENGRTVYLSRSQWDARRADRRR